MVSRDLCPSRPNTGGTYNYPYYFHRGKVLTSRPTLVGRLLLLPRLVYREYPPGAGLRPFTQQSIYSGMCGCQYHACGCDVTGRGHVGFRRDCRMRIWGDTPIEGLPAFTPGKVLSVTTVGGLQDAPAPCMASCIHLGETLPPPPKTLSRVLGVLCLLSP